MIDTLNVKGDVNKTPLTYGSDIVYLYPESYESCSYNPSDPKFSIKNFRPNVATSQISVHSKPMPSYYWEKIEALNKAFDEESKLQLNNSFVIDSNILSTFHQISKQFAELPFDNCSIELPYLESIKLTLLFDSNVVLMISKPLQELCDVKGDQVVFSLFVDDSPVISQIIKSTTLIERFKDYIG